MRRAIVIATLSGASVIAIGQAAYKTWQSHSIQSEARLEGQVAGAREGARQGVVDGTADGLAKGTTRGRTVTYKRAYSTSYARAHKAAFKVAKEQAKREREIASANSTTGCAGNPYAVRGPNGGCIPPAHPPNGAPAEYGDCAIGYVWHPNGFECVPFNSQY